MDLIIAFSLGALIFGKQNQEEKGESISVSTGLWVVLLFVIAYLAGAYLPSLGAGPLFFVIEAPQIISGVFIDPSVANATSGSILTNNPLVNFIKDVFRGSLFLLCWGILFLCGWNLNKRLKKKQASTKNVVRT